MVDNMAHITHRIFFWTLFSIGAVGLAYGFIYQFLIVRFPEILEILQGLVEWIVPFGLGLLIIGLTGLIVTSKRQMRKKLKQTDEYLGEEDIVEDGAVGQVGGRFADYLTSPEQASTVYMMFIAGVLLSVWGIFMFFSWFRGLFL